MTSVNIFGRLPYKFLAWEIVISRKATYCNLRPENIFDSDCFEARQKSYFCHILNANLKYFENPSPQLIPIVKQLYQ